MIRRRVSSPLGVQSLPSICLEKLMVTLNSSSRVELSLLATRIRHQLHPFSAELSTSLNVVVYVNPLKSLVALHAAWNESKAKSLLQHVSQTNELAQSTLFRLLVTACIMFREFGNKTDTLIV